MPDGGADARPVICLYLNPIRSGRELIDGYFESNWKDRAPFFHVGGRVDIIADRDRFSTFHIDDHVRDVKRRRSGGGESGIIELGVDGDRICALEMVAGGRDHFHIFQEQRHAIGKEVGLKRATQAGRGLNLVAECEGAKGKCLAVVGIDGERSFVLSEALASGGKNHGEAVFAGRRFRIDCRNAWALR